MGWLGEGEGGRAGKWERKEWTPRAVCQTLSLELYTHYSLLSATALFNTNEYPALHMRKQTFTVAE